MTPPNECKQSDNVKRLFQFHDEKIEKLQVIEVRQVKIAADVEHIKGRIDNGMSETIARMDSTLTSLRPVIERNSKFINRFENLGWWIIKAVVFALLLIIPWAAYHGWQPKL